MSTCIVSEKVTLNDFLKCLPWYRQVKVVTFNIGYYLVGNRRKVLRQLTDEQKQMKIKDVKDITFVPVQFRRELARQIIIYCEKRSENEKI